MTEQSIKNTTKIRENFQLLAMFIKTAATVEEVEALAAWVAPMNAEIMRRIGAPEGTKTN